MRSIGWRDEKRVGCMCIEEVKGLRMRMRGGWLQGRVVDR